MNNKEMIEWATKNGELEGDVAKLESYPQVGKNKKVAPHEY